MKSHLPEYNGSFRHVLFGFEGRCSRKDYFLKYLLPIFSAGAGLIYLSTWAKAESFIVDFESVPAGLFLIVLNALNLWTFIAAGKKRCQDMDRSPWFLSLNLVPLAGIYVFIALVFESGTNGPNKYGRPAE
ncbi:DUF805 domain-containing protein [Salidesulfovibrio onnuriiensis]|uniref:DUF805 domain-containing protein n=1 Tax=Salidesulfovibrio onnuriiensis TaxID=2583823 RepID=UPI0011CC1D11|nr:DUF805 domain-containing protein [Salidesulfovibrio onnuriiensis]